MPSSISSFSQLAEGAPPKAGASEREEFFPLPGTAQRTRAVFLATVWLLALPSSLLLSAEVWARYFYPRMSRIEARIASDRRQVEKLTATLENDPPSVLILGNSLLLRALDYPKIQQDLAPIRVVRYGIENTEYLDWYYGLRRLFAEGVRPTKVVLILNLGQTLSDGVLAESPYKLFRASDLLAVSRDAGMDTTETSNLVFSHWSAFFAGREGIRNYILNVTDPAYATELHRLARVLPILPSEEQMLRQSRARLQYLNELCRRHGVQFVLVVPPALDKGGEILLKAGDLQGVDVDAPISLLSLTPEYFLADHFHLNERGEALFTEALAHDLRARFGSQ